MLAERDVKKGRPLKEDEESEWLNTKVLAPPVSRVIVTFSSASCTTT